jgi:hypothetical protein
MKKWTIVTLTLFMLTVVMLLYSYHSANPYVVAYISNASSLDQVTFDIKANGNTIFSTLVDNSSDVQIEKEVFTRIPKGKYDLLILAGEKQYVDTLYHFGSSYLYVSFIGDNTGSNRIALMKSKVALPLE